MSIKLDDPLVVPRSPKYPCPKIGSKGGTQLLSLEDIVYLVSPQGSGPVCRHCRWWVEDISAHGELPKSTWGHSSPVLEIVRE